MVYEKQLNNVPRALQLRRRSGRAPLMAWKCVMSRALYRNILAVGGGIVVGATRHPRATSCMHYIECARVSRLRAQRRHRVRKFAQNLCSVCASRILSPFSVCPIICIKYMRREQTCTRADFRVSTTVDDDDDDNNQSRQHHLL